MANFIYNEDGDAVGFWDENVIYKLDGTPVGQVGSSRVDLQACKLEYSIVSPK